MPPQHPGIGIEQDRNQRQPRQGALGPNRRKIGIVPPQEAQLGQGKDKQRQIQQLHVFPGRFVHRRKSRRQGTAATPLVNKVEQHAQGSRKKEASRLPEKQSFLQRLRLPRNKDIFQFVTDEGKICRQERKREKYPSPALRSSDDNAKQIGREFL